MPTPPKKIEKLPKEAYVTGNKINQLVEVIDSLHQLCEKQELRLTEQEREIKGLKERVEKLEKQPKIMYSHGINTTLPISQ